MGDDLKQQSNNAIQEGEIDEDGISSLHDSLLHHILSYLPTREVIRTGVLSKRWKSLWTGVPSLDFEDRLFSCTMIPKFLNIVESVLLRRDGTSIRKFRLLLSHCISSEYYRDVQSLIAAAASHNIQQLDIHLNIYDDNQFTLPCSIFDCRSLIVLKLSMKCTLELPSRISLPRLKVLHMHYNEIPNAETIETLFYSCPVLEELTLHRCKWIQPRSRSITISIPSLRKLTMYCSLEEDDRVDDPNGCMIITVDAPALMYFNYTGLFLANHLYLTNISSSSSSSTSIEACIDMATYHISTNKADRLLKLLRGLENMVSLTISDRTAKLLSLVLPNKVSGHLPVFHHLKHLDLSMNHVTGCALKGLLKLFYFTPNLCSIGMLMGLHHTIRQAGIEWMPKRLPVCFSSSLRTLSLGNFVGNSDEFYFLTNFLEKVVSLERVNIFQNKYIYTDEQVQLMRSEVKRLSERFKHCEIIVQ